MKNRNFLMIIGDVIFIMVLIFELVSCSAGSKSRGSDVMLQVSQLPTSLDKAESIGVYTSGTNLVIKSGTQVYDVIYPYSGSAIDASPYKGTAWNIGIRVNGYEVGTVDFPANGVLGTIAIAAPSDDNILMDVSGFFEYMFGLTQPINSYFTEGADVLIGQLELGDCAIVAPNAFFQDGDFVSGESYIYFYSKGDVTIQLPLTQGKYNNFVEIDIQYKAGWNCISYSESGNTTTIVSKNPPADARWVVYVTG